MVIFRLEMGLNQQLSLKNQYSPLLTLSDFWGVIVDFDPFLAIRKNTNVGCWIFYIYFDFFSLKIPLLDHAASFDLNGLKNGTRKYFENSLKSMQFFQRLH